MFKERKLAVMLKVFLFLIFPFLQNVCLVGATIRNDKAKVSIQNESHKEQSSNQISVNKEEKPKPEDGQLYYMPSQTTFDTIETLGIKGVFSTSPPHLTIKPAPIQTNYQEVTDILNKDSSVIKEHYSSLLPSQCVSETPVAELESRFLLPSKDAVKESVIMSGHLEIASKTSSIEEASEINNIVSKPSIVLQGTILHPHSVADL